MSSRSVEPADPDPFARTGRVDLRAFFPLTFGLAWLMWFAAGRIPAHGFAAVFGPPVFLLGTFSPGIVALFLTWRHEGGHGVRRLVTGIGRWQVDLRWYLFAVGYLITIKLSVALIHRIATGEWPRFGETPSYIMGFAMLISTWVQAGEELGWRAYALPRLARRMGVGGASLVLGLIWAVWHIPLFLAPQSDTFGQSFPLYLLQVTAISVTLTWLYWRTGSLLLVMLMHAAINNTKDIVPSAVPGAVNILAVNASLVGWLTVALLWLAGAFFLARMRAASLDVPPERHLRRGVMQ